MLRKGKMVRKLALAGLIAAVVALPLFYLYGRSLWYPLYVKIQGGESVAEVVANLKEEKGLSFDASGYARLVLVGLKTERILEVWGVTAEGEVQWIEAFPFTGYSGELGPKLREGDRQIPEGIYSVEFLNPNSSFHLSMKLDYPNRFDRKKGELEGRENLGSDIFIHGKSSTIGCIPIGDEGIEKLFVMVSEIGRENVEVILSPYDMRKGTKEIEVDAVEWEDDLYSSIADAMGRLNRQ